MVNDLEIYLKMRDDPAFKSWSFEKKILIINYYLTAVDRQYFSRLKTLDNIVTDIKQALGMI